MQGRKNKSKGQHIYVEISGETLICWYILVESPRVHKPEYVSEVTEEILVLVCYFQGEKWYNFAQ